MKKTLIALAAVAVSSAAMAQVTLAGKLRFAYEATSTKVGTAAAVKANGLRVTDGDFVLSSVEDLGGGMSATASMAVQSRGRDTAIAGRDASLTLRGGFGAVTMGSVEIGNGIIGLGGAGAPVYGMDGSVIAGAVNADMLRYTSPALIPGLTAFASLLDQTTVLGLGSTATTQDATVIGVNYAAGPLAAAVDITTYGRNGIAATTVVADDRVRASASYDLGVAKLGLGVEERSTTATSNNGTSDMIVGVSVPMGATTLGFNYATSKADGGTKVKGFDLGAKYDLSKRTYIAAHFQSVDGRSGDAIATNNENSKYRLQLAHSF